MTPKILPAAVALSLIVASTSSCCEQDPGGYSIEDGIYVVAGDGSPVRCTSSMTLEEAEVSRNTLYITYTDETGATFVAEYAQNGLPPDDFEVW